MGFASQCFTSQASVFPLFRRERSDNFLEAWIAAQRIPIRMELEKAIAKGGWNALHGGDLFNCEVILAGPRVDLCQINGEGHAGNGILGNRQQFARAASLAECFFFPPETGVDRS